jgi:hypothetical protein
MIDLDPALAPWQDPAAAAGWTEDRAVQTAQKAATGAGLVLNYDPGDEEWVLLADETAYQAMISIKFPIALATAAVAKAVQQADPSIEVVEITGFLDEDLRATPELLKMTALPYGWADDFNPEAFCANDLFVESV